MIPRIVHYCWFGQSEMPQLCKECIATWHQHMPDWSFRLWTEAEFDPLSTPYTAEAYAAGRYAFVSDYVRLLALEREGGVYLDCDVEVLRPFDDLLHHHAFAGREGSKHLPVGTAVLASEAHGEWVSQMLSAYDGLHFLRPDGSQDLTTNVVRLTAIMAAEGLRPADREEDFKDLHIFPTEYFSPRHTTGEYIRTANTHCQHLCLNTWSDGGKRSWKDWVLKLMGQKNMTRLIKLKRKLIG